MQAAVLDRLALKLDLQSAMDGDEFFLLYQPLFELDSMRVFGAEALLRWQHPSRGVVGPDEFIPMLEEMARSSRSGSGCSRSPVARPPRGIGAATR